MGIFLAYLGIGLMIGLSGCGSAMGTAIGGCAAIGAYRNRPEGIGKYLTLCALPGTQGLYGFAGFFICQPYVSEQISLNNGAAIFGCGLLLGLAALMSGIYQGKVCASAIVAIGSGKDDALGKGIILAAFPELYAIVAFACTFLIVSGLK